MKKTVLFMPHPPIIIDAIGGQEGLKAKATIQGMQMLAKKIAKIQPDTILFVSPHGNAFSDATCILDGEAFEGAFNQFGHAEISAKKILERPLTDKIIKTLEGEKINTVRMTQKLARTYNIRTGLDHGVLVPMYFIDQEYEDYNIVHVTPGFTSLSENHQIGQHIGRVIDDYMKTTGQEILVVISGDLSHALKDSGPYAFHPDGQVFDHLVQKAFRQKSPNALLDLTPEFVENSAQCGLRPYLVGFGVVSEAIGVAEILSYEGPFGVGYLTGYLESQSSLKSLGESDDYVRLARKSIETYVKTGQKYQVEPELFSDAFLEREEKNKAGVFVSIHKHGELRGCIGTIQPIQDNVIEEIIYNGISACASDPRFNPVDRGELEALEIKVDVLMPIEPIASTDQLDVNRYGVIVEQGIKRGLLLPNLEGIDSVSQQVDIAKQKAGIFHGEFALFRFEVERHG